MEPLAPFELEALRRDWIVGQSGESFFARLEENLDLFGRVGRVILNAPIDSTRRFDRDIEPYPNADCRNVMVIREEEPVEFAAMFFAAVWLGLPVALANPNWGGAEQSEFDALVNQGSAAPGSILIPTGGTTGGVKLAIHEWASLKASALGLQGFLGGSPIHSCCVLPLFHVSGLMQLVRSFVTGGSIRFDDDELEGYCVSMVPTQLQRALRSEESIQKLNTACAVFVGGAAMPEPVEAKVRELGLPVVPVYGMTETAAMVAAVPNADFLAEPDAGAVPLGDAEFAIEADGRIRIQSSALFKGYHGRPSPDLSSGFIVNDVGRLDGDGRLHVIGRADRLINTGGEKVDPTEVEAALLSIEGVSEAFVIGEPDEEWGEAVVAYVVGDALIDLVECKTCLSGKIAPHKMPKKLIRVNAIPAKLDSVGASLGTPAINESPLKFVDPENVAGASLGTPAEERNGAPRDAPTVRSHVQGSVGAPRDAPTVHIRKTERLHCGRVSMPHARYFVTICLKKREQNLLGPEIAQEIRSTWQLQQTDADYVLQCATLMPDHIHLLFTLGERLNLGQCVAKFKAKTKGALDAVGLEWQRDFYDHRLRMDNSMEGFARYIFLNPYRKSLLQFWEPWPYLYLSDNYHPEFLAHLNSAGGPPEEWLCEGGTSVEGLIEIDAES